MKIVKMNLIAEPIEHQGLCHTEAFIYDYLFNQARDVCRLINIIDINISREKINIALVPDHKKNSSK